MIGTRESSVIDHGTKSGESTTQSPRGEAESSNIPRRSTCDEGFPTVELVQMMGKMHDWPGIGLIGSGEKEDMWIGRRDVRDFRHSLRQVEIVPRSVTRHTDPVVTGNGLDEAKHVSPDSISSELDLTIVYLPLFCGTLRIRSVLLRIVGPVGGHRSGIPGLECP